MNKDTVKSLLTYYFKSLIQNIERLNKTKFSIGIKWEPDIRSEIESITDLLYEDMREIARTEASGLIVLNNKLTKERRP